MKERKVPMRKCIGCMVPKPKKECIRICRTPEGEIRADETGKLNGRGAYVCRDPECFEKMVKGRKLNREFGMNIPQQVYEELRSSFMSIISTSGGGNID